MDFLFLFPNFEDLKTREHITAGSKMGDPVAILVGEVISSSPSAPAAVGEAFHSLKASLGAWNDDRRSLYGLSTLSPFILARMSELAGLSLPGQQVAPAGGGGSSGGGGLPRANQSALFHGLDCLYEIEKAAVDYPTPSLLTTPGSLNALRALGVLLHGLGPGVFVHEEYLHAEQVSTPPDFLLLLLEKLALTPEHGAPRAILHARLLPVALALALGEGTSRKETWGGRRSLESTLALFNEVAGVYFESRLGKLGKARGGNVASILRRSDVALLVDCLVEPQADLPGVAPILPRLGALYRWEAGSVGGGSSSSSSSSSSPPRPRLSPPQPEFQWSPLANNVPERHPALLRDLVAGPGMSIMVSHLCALAVGHWRQWGDRYAAAGSPSTGALGAANAAAVEGGVGGDSSKDPVPSNWPFEALRALIVRGGLLALYAAALCLHTQAMATPPTASSEFALEEASLTSLLLALARVLRVLRIDHALTLAREGAVMGTLLVDVLPGALSLTCLGQLLADLLQRETADLDACSDTVISAVLACISALDECEARLPAA